MEWLRNLSDEDLLALEQNNFAAMSDAGLSILEQAMPQGLPTTGTIGPEGLEVTPSFGQRAGQVGSELGRQVGLTARGGVRGAMAIPAMVGDPMMQLINSITGANLPTSSQSLENLMSMVGLPEPRQGLESNVYDITSAMASVGAPAAAARLTSPGAQQALTPLTERLGMQTVAAGSAAGATGVARDAGLGEFGQMGAGLAAGLLVPSAAGIGRGVYSGLTGPMTQAGRQQAAGDILFRGATDPYGSMARMDAPTQGIPGSQPTMGPASRDYGLASMERTLSQMPQASGEYAKRLAQNNLARNVLLEKYTADQALTDAINKREAITGPIRERAFANATPVKATRIINEIDDILKSRIGARNDVESALSGFRERLQREASETGFVDPGRLYSIRSDVKDILDGTLVGSKYDNIKNVASKPLIQLRNSMDEVIESGAPGYRNYMDTYSTMSRPVSQIKEMQNIATKASGGTVDPTTGVRTFTPVRFGKLVEQLEADPRNPLSKTQMGVVKRVSRELDDGAMMNLPGIKPAGSDTFKNITMGNLLGYIHPRMQGGNPITQTIETVISPLNWLYRGSEDAVRELLIEAMLDPKVAAMLMRKATASNILQTSETLMQTAMRTGYGATLGTGVGTQQMERQ
jgi:hypothetical protein